MPLCLLLPKLKCLSFSHLTLSSCRSFSFHLSESKLNLDAPLISTRRMKKEAVSVRRNMTKKLTDGDDSKKSESPSVPILVQDMGCLDHVPNTGSVVFKSPLEKAIDENLRRQLSSKGKHVEEEDEDDDVFSDALDSLSLKDSISGNVEATKPPVASEDPDQSREFMLNRFLPAAKSMTMEQQPQYAMKRQQSPFMSEPVRQQIRDILPAENRATPKRYEYSTSPSYYHGVDDETSDEDEDEASEYLSRRGCGMSPQLCLGMLSSVHGLKEKPYSLRTSSHDQAKSSKVAQLKSRFQSVKKLALDKLGSRTSSPVHPSVGKKFGSEQVDTNLRTASVPSSPYRQTSCLSPYRSVGNCSPLHSAGFPGTRKEAEIMRANRLNKHIKNPKKSQDLLYPKSTRPDCSTSSSMEKTLYVDTDKTPKTSNVKILTETTSEEPEMAGKKPKAVLLEHQAVDSLSVGSGIKKIKAGDLDKKNSGCDMSPLALPTPKKPSESWLLRNLPSVSSKISSRRYLQKKDPKESPNTSVTKWETIVKTSCIHRDHIRYSEELVAHSVCQSTT